MSYSRELKELPYTVISHTIVPKEFTIFLTGEGLKEIVKRVRDGEDVRITVGDTTTIEVVDTHHKYSSRKEHD